MSEVLDMKHIQIFISSYIYARETRQVSAENTIRSKAKPLKDASAISVANRKSGLLLFHYILSLRTFHTRRSETLWSYAFELGYGDVVLHQHLSSLILQNARLVFSIAWLYIPV